MMSILYHDIGLLHQRKGHEEISKTLLEGDDNDAYIINAIDKEIIAAAVVSHSSSKDIAKECSRFSPEEIIGDHKARPAVIAALVRLADELDEDYRRADPILQSRLKLPLESNFYWLFCQRVRGVRPNLISKRIDFNLAFQLKDTATYGRLPGGQTRHFIAFCAEKLAKINQERVTVNRFLPSELQYGGLHIDVKPLRKHDAPRTFVFNDRTTAAMFLQSYPELLQEPAKDAMAGILKLMKQGDLDKADEELDQLASVLTDLPDDVQLQIFYEKACVSSMKAVGLPDSAQKRKEALDQAVVYLIKWFEVGQSGAFKASGRTADAEVHRMAIDSDLRLVCSTRKKELTATIPKSLWPARTGGGGGGTGCVLLGTLIDTPGGKCPVEHLRPEASVISLRLEDSVQQVTTTITRLVASRSIRCIRINQTLVVTPSQPLRTPGAWIEAMALKQGDALIDGGGREVVIYDLHVMDQYFEVFDLTIDDPCHSFVANGLLCHNKK